MDFQTYAAIAFILVLSVIIYFNRKKLEIQKIAFPILYMAMYRTKIGLKLMDKSAEKYPRFFRYAGYAGVFVGFVGMGMICYGLIENLVKIFLEPSAPSGAALVLPFRVKGAIYVPFFFWILCLFILVLIHEFSHGVISRLYKVRIKSSGFAILGVLLPIIPAAFVEPEEKELAKKPRREQLSVFAAGSFSNILLGFICLGIMSLTAVPLVNSMIAYDGVMVHDILENGNNSFPAELAGMKSGEIIHQIDNETIKNIENISLYLSSKSPGDHINILTNGSEYSFELGTNPGNESLPYMGIALANHMKTTPFTLGDIAGNIIKRNKKVSGDDSELIIAKSAGISSIPVILSDSKGAPNLLIKVILWCIGLLFWLFLLNVGIGLFNLVPIPIADGGKMLYLALLHYFDEKKAVRIWKQVAIFFVILIVINIGISFFK